MDFGVLWNGFWDWANKNQLAATVVGGLTLAIIFGIWVRLPKLGAPIRKTWRFFKSIRLTTQTSIDGRLAESRCAGAYEVQSQVDSERAASINHPLWIVGPQQGERNILNLINVADGSIAYDVTISALPGEFVFMERPRWENFTGKAAQPFKGMPTETGRYLGVRFNVEWHDINGDIRQSDIPYQPERHPF
jgi:hypothetical protein